MELAMLSVLLGCTFEFDVAHDGAVEFLARLLDRLAFGGEAARLFAPGPRLLFCLRVVWRVRLGAGGTAVGESSASMSSSVRRYAPSSAPFQT